jgi:hypothetical protein
VQVTSTIKLTGMPTLISKQFSLDVLTCIIEIYTFVVPNTRIPGVVFESRIIRLDSLIIPL